MRFHELALLWAFGAGTAVAQGLPPPPQCATCHGERGASVAPDVPHLDGQVAAYLAESIELLRDRQRKSLVADHIPSEWSSERIREVAQYYGAASEARTPDATDPAKVSVGTELFHDRCEICHDDDGRDTDPRGAGSPKLAGQRLAYLLAQIRSYVRGERPYLVDVKKRSFLGAPMAVRGVSVGSSGAKITEEDADAIAHFLAAAPRTVKPTRTTRLR